MATTNLFAGNDRWTDLSVTMHGTEGAFLISCSGIVNVGGNTCDANGLVAVGPSAGYAVPLALFPSNHGYGFAALWLPEGQTPADPPARGGTQISAGVFAPGIGPTLYPIHDALLKANETGSGPWHLWGICNDNDYGDNSLNWVVTAAVYDYPDVPSITAVAALVANVPTIQLSGS